MHLLFICSRNQWRSPTAETMYKNLRHHQVKSAGTEPSARIRVTAKLIDWADIVFVMEKKHKQRLMEKFPENMSGKSIYILDIPDEYTYMDEELMESIHTSVASLIDLAD